MNHKLLVALFVALIHSPTHALDVCDSSGGDDIYGAFAGLYEYYAEEAMPNMEASFSLTDSCEYTVKTKVQFHTVKSVDDLINAIISVDNNKNSANSNLRDYKLESTGTNTWNQTVKASKSGVTATIKNKCSMASIAPGIKTFTCDLADGDGKIASNKTTITCYTNKVCDFVTVGKAKPYRQLGITIKGPCDLSAGGAAETANGVFRLAQYIAQGKVTDSLWNGPGAKFYRDSVTVREGRLPGSTGTIQLYPYR